MTFAYITLGAVLGASLVLGLWAVESLRAFPGRRGFRVARNLSVLCAALSIVGLFVVGMVDGL